ncbi:hypothetical protein AGMMS49579_01780 [Spirochaetia bacterium]|nr:hypothetical protein AGMMS49579_01780 [Spirochaetia bacterium]
MAKTFHYYKSKVYDQQGLIRAIYNLDYEAAKKQLGFSTIVSPWTVFGYIERINRVDRVVCVNVYGQLKIGGNAHEILQPFLVDERLNKKDREIEGYQLCSRQGAPFPWAVPQKGSSILVESFWLHTEILNTLDAYEGNLYKRIQLDDGSWMYIGEEGSDWIPFKQKQRACWANGKEIIPDSGLV